MRTAYEVVGQIIARLREAGVAQVEGYARFGFIRCTDHSVIVSRETGEHTPIPFAKLEKAVAAVRRDPTVYDGGPSRLRQHGITHLNSPIWAMLHLLSFDEILS